MDLTIEHDDLVRAVAWAGAAVSRKPPVPMLGGIKIEAADDRLTLTGTDYDAFHSAIVDCYTSAHGTIVLSATLLAAVAKSVPGSPRLRFQIDGSTATVTAPRVKYTLPTIGIAEEFPPTPTDETREWVTIGPELSDIVKRAEPIGRNDSVDESVAATAGIWLVPVGGDVMEVWALNRFRGLTEPVTIQGTAPDSPICIPWGSLSAALTDGPVEMSWTDGMIAIRSTTTTIKMLAWMRTLPGAFPDRAMRAFSQDAEAIATWDRDQLTEALKAATLGAVDHGATMTISIRDDEASLSLHSNESDAAVTVPCEGREDHELYLDPLLLAGLLGATPKGAVTFSRKPNQPMSSTVWTSDQSEILHILAPKAKPGVHR